MNVNCDCNKNICEAITVTFPGKQTIMKHDMNKLDHVYYRWTRSTYRATVDRYIGRLSVDYRSTIGRLSVDYRSMLDRLSDDSRPILDR